MEFMKKTLQVKYCYTEEELNEFLKTLTVNSVKLPSLHSIQYCARVSGGDNVSFSPDGEKEVLTSIKSEVIAVVQYFVEPEKGKEE